MFVSNKCGNIMCMVAEVYVDNAAGNITYDKGVPLARFNDHYKHIHIETTKTGKVVEFELKVVLSFTFFFRIIPLRKVVGNIL